MHICGMVLSLAVTKSDVKTRFLVGISHVVKKHKVFQRLKLISISIIYFFQSIIILAHYGYMIDIKPDSKRHFVSFRYYMDIYFFCPHTLN